MVESKTSNFSKASAFRIFKICIFWILMLNLFYYLYEDVTAYLYLAADSTPLDKIEAFAVSIDYIAWMVLIILFELETTALSRDVFTGMRKWVITGLTALCYVVLVYAAYGYAAGLAESYHFEPIESESACHLADENFAYLNDEARPIALTDSTCGVLDGQALYKSPNDNLVVSASVLPALRKLGWIDVFNATAWLLIVLLFQIEFSLEQANLLTKRRLMAVKVWKGLSYLVLLACAIYWTVFSAFIDSWDAWLWLLAFILIDLNVLGLDEDPTQVAVGENVVAS